MKDKIRTLRLTKFRLFSWNSPERSRKNECKSKWGFHGNCTFQRYTPATQWDQQSTAPLKIPLDIQLPITSDEWALFDLLNTLIPKIMHMIHVWQNKILIKDESAKEYLRLNVTEKQLCIVGILKKSCFPYILFGDWMQSPIYYFWSHFSILTLPHPCVMQTSIVACWYWINE